MTGKATGSKRKRQRLASPTLQCAYRDRRNAAVLITSGEFLAMEVTTEKTYIQIEGGLDSGSCAVSRPCHLLEVLTLGIVKRGFGTESGHVHNTPPRN